MERVRRFFKDFENISAEFNSIYHPEYPFPATPDEFLEYAESDLKSDLPQSSVNSLGNTKRALDSQLDFFFKVCCLSRLSETNRWQTGRKIRVIGDLGVVPNRILHKVSQARNDMEHKFQPPSIETAANALDVVGLFVAATDMYLIPVHDCITYHNRSTDEYLTIRLTSCNNDKIEVLGTDYDLAVDPLSSTADHLSLLTFLLHYRRFGQKNCSRFFKKLKYVQNNEFDVSDN